MYHILGKVKCSLLALVAALIGIRFVVHEFESYTLVVTPALVGVHRRTVGLSPVLREDPTSATLQNTRGPGRSGQPYNASTLSSNMSDKVKFALPGKVKCDGTFTSLHLGKTGGSSVNYRIRPLARSHLSVYDEEDSRNFLARCSNNTSGCYSLFVRSPVQRFVSGWRCRFTAWLVASGFWGKVPPRGTPPESPGGNRLPPGNPRDFILRT